MITGLTSPGDDLDVLRQQYDRLCDVLTRTAETDPVAAERVLVELQSLSERILALEASAAEGGKAPPAPPGAATPPAAPATAAAPRPAPPPRPEGAPEAGTPRVVAFRVIPATDADGKVTAKTTSWRVDTSPPPAAGGPTEPAASPAKAVAPTSAPAPAEPPPAEGEAPAGPTMFSAAIRRWLERHRDDAVASTGPAGKRADESTSARTKPAATKPAPPKPVRPKPAAAEVETATPVPARAPAPAEPAQPRASASGTVQGRSVRVAAATRPAGATTQPAPARRDTREMARIAAAIQQQAVQIERILELSISHQAALERLEAQIQAELRAPAPAAAPDPRIAELRAAVAEQRQRLTALAKTIHNLAQWLAAERAGPKR